MKKILLSAGIALLLVCLSYTGSAIVIDPSTQFLIGNETHTVNATMIFNQIILSDSYIVVNDTCFYISSPNSITISLLFINDDIASAVNGKMVFDFYATATSGTVVFDLSGFSPSNEYRITRNGLNHSTSTANGTGVISFSNTIWGSPQRFEVFSQTHTSGDTTTPQISWVTHTTSDLLDTSPTYGWVNVCRDFSSPHDYSVLSGFIDSSTYFVGVHQALFIENTGRTWRK